jgi:hypothetical protein
MLSVPASARYTTTPGTTSNDGGSAYAQILESTRLLGYGTQVGLQVLKGTRIVVNVPAGAPGTLTVDFLAQVPTGGGSATMVGTAGKLVYLEIVQKTGVADLAIRRAGANALEILSGTTDAMPVRNRQILVDVQESNDVRVSDGLTFDATHKQIQLESTAGCQVEIEYCVC